MNRMVRELGHEQIKVETLKFAAGLKVRRQVESHGHDHAHEHGEEHDHEHEHGEEHGHEGGHELEYGKDGAGVHAQREENAPGHEQQGQLQNHEHEQESGHGHVEVHEHDCTSECSHEKEGLSHKNNAQDTAATRAENLRKREAILRERFIYMLPGVNKNLFFPVDSGLLAFFGLCCFLSLVFTGKKSW
jgi:hypothetical protein